MKRARLLGYLAAVAIVSAALSFSSLARAQATPEVHPDLPDDFKQIIPRGRIASVDDPQFVPAAEAEISDDAWVFGVVVEGKAHAYSLNLLNRHEIVNDRIAGRPIAAVW